MRNRSEVVVLLIDDEEGIRESLTINLELDGFKILSASGGNDAIEILKNNKIDFIISDVRMPKGDGVSLLKYVKEHYPELPHVVLISGFAEINAKEAKSLGAIDLLLKPASIDYLIELIKTHCLCD
ncbi:MAG: response regulator [Bacteriovorax sp.]|nr:response regulator [Bacteriovorax sp.]